MANKLLLNILYLKPQYERDTNMILNRPNNPYNNFNRPPLKKVCDDALFMVIRDNDTGEKEIKIIERPTIEYFVVKDKDNVPPYSQICIPKNLVEPRVVEYSKRELEMCKELGIDKEYIELRRKNPPFNVVRDFINENVYKSPYIYSANTQIETYYKEKFIKEHGLNVPTDFNVSYYDIEVYIYKSLEKITEDNPNAPINIITYFNNKTRVFTTMVLNIHEIPDIIKVKENINEYIEKYIKPDIKEEDNDIVFKTLFFESEAQILLYFGELIKNDKPDFALAWNSHFDIKYIIGRANKLGINIKRIFCHPDVPEKYQRCEYIEDYDRVKNNFMSDKDKKHFSRMWDLLFATSYTLFIDQMAMYSNLRRRYIERSYKLKDISNKILGITKVDLKDYKLTIRNAPFKDFKIFLKYSIRDTYLLYKMEDFNSDCAMLMTKANLVQILNAHNPSIIVESALYEFFLESQDCVSGNTIDYKADGFIPGAIIANPLNLDGYPIKVNGKKTSIYKYVIDFDAKAEYPSLMVQFRIGKETIFTRIIQLKDENNRFIMDGSRFNEMLQNIDTSIIDLCHEFYGLPNIEDVFNELETLVCNS